MKRLILLLPLAASLVGCAGLEAAKETWSGLTEMITGKDNSEPPAELDEDFQAKLNLTVQWEASVGDGYDGKNVNLLPAVTEDSVYAADRKGVIQAYNRQSGERRWEVESDLVFTAGPVFHRGLIVLGTSDAEIAAFSIADGSLLWKTSVSSEIFALPTIADGVVVIRGTDGQIIGLDEKDGHILWHHERTAPPLAVRSKGGPLVVKNTVFDGYGSGKLIALNLKTGQTEWEVTVALAHGRSEIDRLLDINATPVVKGDTLYVSGYQAGIAAVALKDGEVQWRQERFYSSNGLSSNKDALFLSDANSDVWRIDMRNGSDMWKQKALHQRRLTPPAPIRDKLVVGDLEGYVHVLSQDTGALLARLPLDGSAIEATPVVFDNHVYVYTSGGKLAALNLE